ncbi:TRAP transporter small permease [Ammoniphilus sp. YIM 78166]|uniref:TRAP transporter small permease n=1 Tax=Ammoniphilus sp. YIM 78166 TaxID=1644106 RepID=UPI0010705438|nr:TRAP transporter small permease [Ammoniphilus sp. YIM 78166]
MISKLKTMFDKSLDYFSFTLLIVLTLVCFYQVVARYLFSAPPSWSEELARYLMIWLTFLGAAIAFRTNAHLGLDFFVGLLPGKGQRWVSWMVGALLLVVLGLIFSKGFEVAQSMKSQLSPAMRISMAYPYMAVPVGTFLMMFEMIWNLIYAKPKEEVN